MHPDSDDTVDERLALASRLRSARRSKGLTQHQAAGLIGMSRTTLVAVEKADRSVRPDELLDLARLYDISVNHLLRPTPSVEDFAVKFRTSPVGKTSDAELANSVRLLQELADDYAELERLAGAPLPRHYPPQVDLGRSKPEVAAAVLAAKERNRLGLGDGPILDIRRVLESDVGLRIFAISLPSRVAGIFVYSDQYGGCIAINANHPPEKRRWSLAHEYGHFLAHRHDVEITLAGAYRRQPSHERFADAFAENFLMPELGMRQRFSDIRQPRSDEVTPADLVDLADRFWVSFEALTLRLENLGLLRKQTLDRLKGSGFKVSEARELLGFVSRPIVAQLLPLRYRLLAVQALKNAQISEGQFAKFLRIDRIAARRMVASVAEPGSSGTDPESKLRSGYAVRAYD